MSDEKKDAPGCAEAAVYLFVLWPLHVVVSAYVGWKLWLWFAVPVLALPSIGYGYALTGAAFVSWLKPVPPDTGKTRTVGELSGRVTSIIFLHGLLLLVGYIGHRMVTS